MLRAYGLLTHFRNLCAHDERLYCARKGNDTYAAMLGLLNIALPVAVVSSLKGDLNALLHKHEADLKVITVRDLKDMLGL